MSDELVPTSGDNSNRISSIMNMDYETPNEEDKEDREVELDQDDKKPAPSNEQPKKKEKANPAKSDKNDEEESEEKSEEEESEDEEVEEEKEEEKSDKKKLKYKVDGEEFEEEFSDEDLSSAVAAKKASLKRINEINVEKKKIQSEREELMADVDYVKNEMHGIRGSFEKDIESFKKNGVVSGNPLSPIYNLLDKMGLDTASFDKAALFYFLPMAEKFSSLSDEGRDLFLSRHENEWHKRRQTTLDTQKKQIAEEQRKFAEETSELRKANLSSEQVDSLKGELSEMGVKDITAKKVIEWNHLKPFYTRAQGIVDKVPGTNLNKIARILVEFPETTDDEILNQLGYKEVQKQEVAKKLTDGVEKKKTKDKSENRLEEEVDSMFNKMFRR